jgi:hypothetical protein
MFVSAPAIRKIYHNETKTLASIQRSAEHLGTDHQARAEKLLTLFDARALCAETPLMASGWVRDLDADIIPQVAYLLTRRPSISLVEIAAGTTWGSRDSDFGVPGLARILKDALGAVVKILATDRAQGFDIFLVLPDGLLIHHQYRDDQPPLALGISPWLNSTTLAPIPQVMITQSLHVDRQFKKFLESCGRQFNFDPNRSAPRIYIRPRVDPEAELRLYGVESLGRVDYTALSRCLVSAGRPERFDLAYGRHLCPVFGEDRVDYLIKSLPNQLGAVADSYCVQFDRCLTPQTGFADIIFRHHPHLFEEASREPF